jgi:zinc transporter ZupT
MCDEYWKKMKLFCGLALLVFGVIWYLREIGAIILEPFWPIMVMLAGMILIIKALMTYPETKRRR